MSKSNRKCVTTLTPLLNEKQGVNSLSHGCLSCKTNHKDEPTCVIC